MKRFLPFIMMMLFVNTIFAQNNSFIINETFDTPNMPEGWYFTGEGADNFSISSTNNAGGDANELLFKSSPIVTAGIHLVMATADLTDVEELGLSFKHYLNYDQLSHTLGIATSSDNGTTWNTAWSQTFSNASATGLHEVNETIKTSDMGKNNVLICLFYEGNTYNFNKWYFDNISIFPKTNNSDLQLASIDVNNVVPTGDVEISFTANNIGGTEITSFEASYEIEGYGTVTETFNETITPSNNKTVTFKKDVNLLPGTHTININIININGENDSNTDNNSMSKEVRTFIKEVERTPLLEHFSSSTCINCIPVDTTLLALTHNNEGRYTYVKYPWDYPNPGDPYYLEDCTTRGQYYRVTGVPAISFDGGAITRQPKQSHFDDRYAVTSYVDIIGAFDVEGNTVNVTADVLSYIDLPEAKVFVTVNEKTTVGNVVSGSLPEFHHVLMKMLSGVEGIDTDFEAGKYQRYEFSVDMSETNVEEMNDLEVAVWVQNYDSKEIYNSHFLNEYTSHLYPVQNIKIEEKTVSWEAPEKGNPTGYNVLVNNNLVAENISETSYEFTSSKDKVLVEVVAIYENGAASAGVCATSEVENDNTTPTNLAVTPQSTSSIALTWNEVENATSYNVYRDTEKITEVTTTNYTDEGLEYNTRYCYTVTSIVNGKESEHSEKVCVKTLGEGIEEISTSIELYPNPVENELCVATELHVEEISIYDIYGRLCCTDASNASTSNAMDTFNVSVRDLNSGVYFINIKTDKGNIVKRFIKKLRNKRHQVTKSLSHQENTLATR